MTSSTIFKSVRGFFGRLARRLRASPQGEVRYQWTQSSLGKHRPLVVLATDSTSPDQAAHFLAQQTLSAICGIEVVRHDSNGANTSNNAQASFFFAPGDFPAGLPPAFLESLVLVGLAEEVDAVAWLETDAASEPLSHRAFLDQYRHLTIFSSASYRYGASKDTIEPAKPKLLIKVLGKTHTPSRTSTQGYVANFDLSSGLTVALRAASFPSTPTESGKPKILVTVPFLARGGAEHTLFETLKVLAPRVEAILVTLAPHSAELGDRRADFAEFSPRLFSLGDWLYPAAMPDVLEHLIAAYRPVAWYNANGTTLFYDFAPRIKRRFPDLPIIDHLYDHKIGYITSYDRTTLEAVDICIAENHPIAAALAEQGWPAARVPVIWPCGRPREVFAVGDSALATKKRRRQELEVGDDELMVLTAARLHPQKRPFDLIEVARRTSALPIRFVWVGGGPLEVEFREQVAAAQAEGAKISTLPFREDIPDLILAADVGCLVSDYEGLPVFLLECLQAGKPFLGTNVGDLGKVVKAANAGWIIEEPGDIDGLVAAVHALLDPEERQRRAAAATIAGRDFDVEACAERYAAILLRN